MKTLLRHRAKRRAKADSRGTVQVVVHLVGTTKKGHWGCIPGNMSWSVSVKDATVGEIANLIAPLIGDSVPRT